jgi:hypothetical protein
MNVLLTVDELYVAAITGVHRQITSLDRDYVDRTERRGSKPNTPWEAHIEGAAAELVVARTVDRYPTAMIHEGGAIPASDVSQNMHVRHTPEHDRCLIVRPGKDPEDGYFFLVTGQAPSYVIRGWITGRDARQDRFVRDPGGVAPAWFVPQSELKPLVLK